MAELASETDETLRDSGVDGLPLVDALEDQDGTPQLGNSGWSGAIQFHHRWRRSVEAPNFRLGVQVRILADPN